MTRREFDRTIKSCAVGGLLSAQKLTALADDLKARLVAFLVRARKPIVAEMIGAMTSREWLHACGYLYITKGKFFTFHHTSEQRDQVT